MNSFFNLFLVCGSRILSWFLLDGKGRLAANIALVLANGVPILGVLFFGWNAFSILMLYWFESLVIGVLNLARLVSSGAVGQEGVFSVLGLATGLFLAVFFTIHYGLFLFVHLIFLLVGGSISGALPIQMGDPFAMIPAYFELQGQAAREVVSDPLGLFFSPIFGVFLVVLSASIYFYSDFLRPRAYRFLSPPECMMEPYQRIVIMQVAIIFGFILTTVFKWPAGIMAVFVVVKTAHEVRFLNRTFQKKRAV